MVAMKRLILTVLMRAAVVAAVVGVGKPSAAEAQGAGAAKEEKEEKPAAKEEKEAEELPKVEAVKEAEVRKLVGRKAVVSGRVSNTHESEKGITFITLEGGKFTVVCWKESYGKFEGGSPAKLYKGKTIEVTGDIFEYKGKDGGSKGQLEIKLREPGQVKVTGEAARVKEGSEGEKGGEKAEPGEKTEEEKSEGEGKPPRGRVDAKKYFR
jgi:DNA/RNA endonuclease YhcR with UshA esterase domain